MFFIENAAGEKIATATAFYDIYGCDTSNDGWLHWVACKVYMDLGFSPVEENLKRNHEGWQIVKALTGHRKLFEHGVPE